MPRLVLYGNFGNCNLGNECTLSAAIGGLKETAPDAELLCVCSDPENVSRDHGIPAVPIDTHLNLSSPEESAPWVDRRSPAARLLNLATVKAPWMSRTLRRALRTLRKNDVLVLVGTGMFEYGSPAWLLSLLAWSLAARLHRGRIIILSMGAGPYDGRPERFLSNCVLRLADYVSYRDQQSKDYVAGTGLDTSRHLVVPDLAFGLSTAHLRHSVRTSSGGDVVGIGVGDASKFEDSAQYRSYLEDLCSFVLGLIEQGRSVHLIHGDGLYDRPGLTALQELLRTKGATTASRSLRVPHIASYEDLYRAIAELDLVIVSRYHNMILALLLGKPVISLSYHWKFEAIMSRFGLGAYCRPLSSWDPLWLRDRFDALIAEGDTLSRQIRAASDDFRKEVIGQYEAVDALIHTGSSPAFSLPDPERRT